MTVFLGNLPGSGLKSVIFFLSTSNADLRNPIQTVSPPLTA